MSGDINNAVRLAEEGSNKFPEHVGFVQLKGEAFLKMGEIQLHHQWKSS